MSLNSAIETAAEELVAEVESVIERLVGHTAPEAEAPVAEVALAPTDATEAPAVDATPVAETPSAA